MVKLLTAAIFGSSGNDGDGNSGDGDGGDSNSNNVEDGDTSRNYTTLLKRTKGSNLVRFKGHVNVLDNSPWVGSRNSYLLFSSERPL